MPQNKILRSEENTAAKENNEMIYEMRCPGTNFEKPGILTPVTDGTAIFPSVPAAIFTITDQTKERYKKLHAFQSPFGSSRREIGLPKGDWKAWSISTNIPFWGIGIAPILSPVTAKGRVRSAD